MNQLKNKSASGEITVDNEVFDIKEGRFSFTPKEDFYMINFWIKVFERETENDVFPPTIEILMKTKENLLETSFLKLEITSEVENGVEWEVNYNTGYYDGIHQNFRNAKLEISKLSENLYSVEFSGIPDRFKSAKGICKLELKDDYVPHWG